MEKTTKIRNKNLPNFDLYLQDNKLRNLDNKIIEKSFNNELIEKSKKVAFKILKQFDDNLDYELFLYILNNKIEIPKILKNGKIKYNEILGIYNFYYKKS